MAKTRSQITCVCGTTFQAKASSQRKFCSPHCYHKFLTTRRGADTPAWNGGRLERDGRVLIYRPEHQRAHSNGYVYEHILVAESALGKPLPVRAVVHHVNER